VELAEQAGQGGEVVIRHASQLIALRRRSPSATTSPNLLAAVAAARALGVTPEGELRVRFSALRGERIALPGGSSSSTTATTPPDVHARAIEDLTETATARRVAVLGDMLELGREAGPGCTARWARTRACTASICS